MELSLWSRIHDKSHDRTQRVLHGLTGMAALPFCEYSIAYAPYGANLYAKLVTDVDVEERALDPEWLSKLAWSMKIEDIPEAGSSQSTVSRLSIMSRITEGDAMHFMEKLGYTYAYEYITQGDRFIYRDAVISLFRIFRPTSRLVSLVHGYVMADIRRTYCTSVYPPFLSAAALLSTIPKAHSIPLYVPSRLSCVGFGSIFAATGYFAFSHAASPQDTAGFMLAWNTAYLLVNARHTFKLRSLRPWPVALSVLAFWNVSQYGPYYIWDTPTHV